MFIRVHPCSSVVPKRENGRNDDQGPLSQAIQKSLTHIKQPIICGDGGKPLDFEPEFAYKQALLDHPNPEDAQLLLSNMFYNLDKKEEMIAWAGNAISDAVIRRHLTFRSTVDCTNIQVHGTNSKPRVTVNSFVFEVASGCHHDCVDCSHGELRKTTKGYQMSLEQVEKFMRFTEKSNYHIKELSIHGPGEPLLWKHLNEALPDLYNSSAIDSINILSNGRSLNRVKEKTWDCIDLVDISIYDDDDDYDLVLNELSQKNKQKLNIMRKVYFYPRVKKNEVYDIPCICIGQGPMQVGDVTFLYCGPQVFDAASLLDIDIYDLKYLYVHTEEDYLSQHNPCNQGNMAICRHCWANGNRYIFDNLTPSKTSTSGGGWQ